MRILINNKILKSVVGGSTISFLILRHYRNFHHAYKHQKAKKKALEKARRALAKKIKKNIIQIY